MNLRRLRLAEWAALTGAVGLLVTLFLDWFSIAYERRPGWAVYASGGASTTGWGALGWFTLLLLVVCVVSAAGLAAALVFSGLDAFHNPPGVVLAAFSVPALVVLFAVMLTRPSLGLDLPNAAVAIEPVGWAGLLFAVLMAAGGIASLRDERTTGEGRRYVQPPRRPAPPAG